MQLSPIFGLFADVQRGHGMLYANLGRPELSGVVDGVQNDLWSVIDAELENRVIDWMGTKPVYIADGHHRYTTRCSTSPSRSASTAGRCRRRPGELLQFVLVGMQDDGLIILPTHRMIGGLSNFDAAAFRAAVAGNFDVAETPLSPDHVDEFVNVVPQAARPHVRPLRRAGAQALPAHPEEPRRWPPSSPTAATRGGGSTWRSSSRYLLDEVLGPGSSPAAGS